MSELTRRPCAQRNETFYDSHLKVEADVNNNSTKKRNGSVRKRDVVYTLIHAFTLVALIHAYTHINHLSSSNKDAG